MCHMRGKARAGVPVVGSIASRSLMAEIKLLICKIGSRDDLNDTGCYKFASIMDILASQGMDLAKPILFSNLVEVLDGYHFYYNAATDDKLANAEIFDIIDSTNFES